jgi:hypothetical protein
MTPNDGFGYLLEQLPIVGKFVVAQIADNTKSLSYTISQRLLGLQQNPCPLYGVL